MRKKKNYTASNTIMNGANNYYYKTDEYIFMINETLFHHLKCDKYYLQSQYVQTKRTGTVLGRSTRKYNTTDIIEYIHLKYNNLKRCDIYHIMCMYF